MKRIAILLTFIISQVNLVWANDPIPGPLKAPVEHAVTGKHVSKKQWMENLQNTLPNILCEDNQHFMACFSTTKKECLAYNKLFVQACLNNVALALPAELNAEEASHWGAVMGKCTFDLYEKFMQAKKSKKPECNLPAKAKTDK